jgi:hypothetical protein
MLSDTKDTGGSTVEKNSQVKAHYDALLGRTYTWYVLKIFEVRRIVRWQSKAVVASSGQLPG